ncbi:hypothetical protein [Halochromatium glycolicum]|jgi:hypothetical protein|uniref:hypothetical protein n=1 Tax=Halochromatium glycolicum TaxID=85075 RepID=UPI00190AF34C|nr:hypothetical protein [Halochromatium glycolicum]
MSGSVRLPVCSSARLPAKPIQADRFGAEWLDRITPLLLFGERLHLHLIANLLQRRRPG